MGILKEFDNDCACWLLGFQINECCKVFSSVNLRIFIIYKHLNKILTTLKPVLPIAIFLPSDFTSLTSMQIAMSESINL